MTSRVTRRRLATTLLGLCAGAAFPGGRALLAAGPWRVDPAQVVPLDRLAPEHRAEVAEVIRDATIHRKGAPDTFPCQSAIYLSLVNEPGITLALWQDLADSPVRLRQLAPGRYEGTDGNGASATWEFALRSPTLHVFLCRLDYTSPRGNAHLEGRIVLVVRSGFFRESTSNEPVVRHDVEAFVKVDSKGWKTLARTVRPILEKVLEDQVQEAGLFVSLMGRLVETYPNWACQVAAAKAQASPEAKQAFREAVLAHKRKDADPGRPRVIDQTAQSQPPRRRS
jgi:hypothetical protein